MAEPDSGTRVVNKADHTYTGNEVDIMRPGPWGNPFRIGYDGTRAEVVAKHLHLWRLTLERRPEALRMLAGKTLVCCCAPLACHGDNYVRLIRERYEHG